MTERQATGWQLLEIVNGGSANGGQDVYWQGRYSDGENEFEAAMFCELARFPSVLTALQNAAGMAHRIQAEKGDSLSPGDYLATRAQDVKDVQPGVDPVKGRAVLVFQTETDMRVPLAMDRAALVELGKSVSGAIKELDRLDRSEGPAH